MPEIALEGPYFAEFPLDTSVHLFVVDVFIFFFFVEALPCPLHSTDVGVVESHTKSPWYEVFPGS